MMTMKVEHELHGRRKGRNWGVFILLIAFVALVFGLTVVKVTQLGDASKFKANDHVLRPELLPTPAEPQGQNQ